MKHKYFVTLVSIVGLAALILMLNLTSPTEIGPFGVLVFFTTLYVVIFGAVCLLIWIFYHLALGRKVFRGKDYLYSAVLAFGPIMVLMARAFGAINFWTLALIILFLSLAEFLVMKRV
ncbi:hypothetical protein IJ135_01705 [Candidatus Saccharibacteria bacterium]|nr:hypothetical protein [Candidatus Saccharibacteria bacterium]